MLVLKLREAMGPASLNRSRHVDPLLFMLTCLDDRFSECLRPEKLQNESFPNDSSFHPELCPEFCSEFCPKFSRSFRASFRGKRRPEKFHQKFPPFFSAKFPGKYENSNLQFFWRAGKVRMPAKLPSLCSQPQQYLQCLFCHSGNERQPKEEVLGWVSPRTSLVAQCSAAPATVPVTPPCSATPFQAQISVRHLPGMGGGGVRRQNF